MRIDYQFVPMGFVAKPEPGKVYVDVGNAFCPGVLDHHHPDAPDACTALLVFRHPEFVTSQVRNNGLTIIPHEYPDLDAIAGAWFATRHARLDEMSDSHEALANYVCSVDRGHTTLDASQPVTPYSLFMMRMHMLREDGGIDSRTMLLSGFGFLEQIIEWKESGGDFFRPDGESLKQIFPSEAKAVESDMKAYQRDLARAEKVHVKLPLKNGRGFREVPGLWIEQPESALFKSWARGDRKSSGGEHGFIFLGVQVSDHRFILSVDPASEVGLKGLGEALERAETVKRMRLGMERKGENRPGYDSPDPWYDGRSPLHNYTIIDSPRAGTILIGGEVKKILDMWMKEIKRKRGGA